MSLDAGQVLAFRFARSGLAARRSASLASAAACPASDFARDAALLALAARSSAVTRAAFDAAVDDGSLVMAHVVRGAIHAVAPDDFALYGRALLARDDDELAAQLGRQAQQLLKPFPLSAGDALAEVADGVRAAVARGRAVDKNTLHEELRARVREELMPWCRGCGSHHVAPMLWRYATVAAGARLDSDRRYVAGRPGRAPAAAEAVRRFLGFYGPSVVSEFADWAGLARAHARRLWKAVDDLTEVRVGKSARWALADDFAALDSPPEAEGVRLLPPGDPFLQKPNRPLLAPDDALRKRLFRPVASPGAVFVEGRLVGLWRMKLNGKKPAELSVEKLDPRFALRALQDEAERVAELRGAPGVSVVAA